MIPVPIQWIQLSFVSWGRNSFSEDSSPCSSGTGLKSLRTFRALRPLRALSRFEGIKVKILRVWGFIWMRIFHRYGRRKEISGFLGKLIYWMQIINSFHPFHSGCCECTLWSYPLHLQRSARLCCLLAPL